MCPAHRYRLEAPAPQGFGAVAAIERDDRPAVTERVPRCRPAMKVIKRAARWKCQAAFITHGAPGSAPLPRRTSAAVHVPPNRLASRTCSRKRKRGRRTRYRGVSSTRTGADTADGTTAHGGVDVGGRRRRSRHRRGRASDEVRRAVRGAGATLPAPPRRMVTGRTNGPRWRIGTARPWRSQSGLQTIWWTPLRSAHCAATGRRRGRCHARAPCRHAWRAPCRGGRRRRRGR